MVVDVTSLSGSGNGIKIVINCYLSAIVLTLSFVVLSKRLRRKT